jgi:CO/xanthine dehydrogenase Mo-binding subunit
VRVATHAIDMGSGTATALSLATAQSLGVNAHEIETGIVEKFAALRLVEGFKPRPDDPRWTPLIFSSTKASGTAGCWVHGVEQASRVLLEAGLLPAAREIWGGNRRIAVGDVRWTNGALAAEGLPPIPLARLANRAHDRGHVVSAMIHAFFSGEWAEADYTVGADTYRWQIDALAIRRGRDSERILIDRKNAKLMTVESTWAGNGQRLGATACLVAVSVDRRTGSVAVLEGVQFVNPGKILQQDLLEGQLDGCFAMAVGQALLEYLPPYEDGAGNGLWNLHRYNVPLAGDVAVGKIEKVIFPPETPDAPARGVAEVAMVAVAPAIANAVAHATGIRVRDLPITPEKILAGWRL